MTATVHSIFDRQTPEYLAPSFSAPVGGPIDGHREKDHRADFKRLQEDMVTAWDFARAQHLAVLTVAADRNGAYLVIAPSRKIYTLFGDEAACWKREPSTNGLWVEFWMGCIGHIRVFWREVKCAH